MKKILLLIILTTIIKVYAQDTSCNDSIIIDKSIYNVEGNRGMSFSEGLFPAKMTGIIAVNLMLDCKGKILKYDIIKIAIEDSTANYSMKYFNKEITPYFGSDKPIPLFIYPQYVSWILPEIELQLKKIKFKKLPEYEYINAANRFSVIMRFI